MSFPKTLFPRLVILMADDDPADAALVRRALHDAGLDVDFRHVSDGRDLLDYLRQEGAYAGAEVAPLPDLVLLDIAMPADGLAALHQIKTDPRLANLPVVVLTNSRDPGDVSAAYRHGANSYIGKPVTYDTLVDVMRDLGTYWYRVVTRPSLLPPTGRRGPGARTPRSPRSVAGPAH